MNRSPLRTALTLLAGPTRPGVSSLRRTAPRRRPALEALEGRTLLTAGLTEFAGPFLNPSSLVTGPDGNFWVAGTGDSGDSTLTVVAPDGSVKATYTVPTPNAGVSALTPGPDGNVWFTETFADKIGKVTPAGVFTEYALPNATGGDAPVDMNAPSGPAGVQASPTGIVAGADGALWFTESSADAIGRITTDGVVSQTATPGLQPNSLTVGPDKAIWFTDNSTSNTIDRLNADGTLAKFPLPSQFALPTGLTVGPDGALWFAESGSNAIGRMTTGGAVTETPILGDFSSPMALAFDSGGNIWVTGYGGGVARVTPKGLTLLVGQQPAADVSTTGITTGPGGAIWFTDASNNQIGRIDPSAVTSLATDHPLSTGPVYAGQSVYETSLTFTDSVATFYDGNPSGAAADFTARINWGDGTTSDGAVVLNSPGQFSVNGTHTYAQFGTYTATVTITDVNPAHTPQPNALTVSTTLDVSDQPPPILLTGGGPMGKPGVFPIDAAAGAGRSFTNSHAAGVPGAKSTGAVVKKRTTTPVNNWPSATELLRAGYLKNWFTAARSHPVVKTVTAPAKVHAVVVATKPVKHVKTVKKTAHKTH